MTPRGKMKGTENKKWFYGINLKVLNGLNPRVTSKVLCIEITAAAFFLLHIQPTNFIPVYMM